MHRRRTTQAFDRPPVIQIGNSVQNLPAAYINRGLAFSQKRTASASATQKLFAIFYRIVFDCSFALLFIAFVGVSKDAISGDLQNVTFTLKDSTAGAGAIYLLSFETQSGLPSQGKILIHFPAAFDLSNTLVAGDVNGNLRGGFIVDVDVDDGNNILILERDGTGP